VAKFPRTILITAALGAAWIATVAFGMRLLLDYQNKPGSVATVPATFPAKASIYLAEDTPTLVMLAHPRCPCTRASIGELAQIMAELQGRVKAYVLFSAPKDSGEDWNDTALWHSAAAIPGVIPVGDEGGVEARRFGAETSGHTLLFAPGGRLHFSGGITESRGHVGANAGEASIMALVKNGPPDRTRTTVFGCSLVGSDAAGQKSAALR
jgi:hypothetical protein